MINSSNLGFKKKQNKNKKKKTIIGEKIETRNLKFQKTSPWKICFNANI